ncbi:MAG: NYN domain-containing protein [Patescibacteria group bacterium]
MFDPKTDRIAKLARIYPGRIKELSAILTKKTNVYLDWSNMFHWSTKLNWHIDVKRLKQLLSSFTTIHAVNLYTGILKGDDGSEQFAANAQSYDYIVVTKPVKIMRLSTDISGIPLNSPTILENFIKKPLLRKLNIETIEFLNGKLKELYDQGTKYLEVRKCNFDVEIGRDMLLDFERNSIDTYILWSGDSDFADPVIQLRKDKKQVFIFATSRRVSVELQETNAPIFDIQKIRNFICEPSEIQPDIRGKLS